MPELTMTQVSQQFDISAHTLRYYDNNHLIPGVIRNARGRRVFTEDAQGWLRYILAFRSVGMSIKKIRHYVDLTSQGTDTIDERLTMLVHQQSEIDKQITDLNDKKKLLQWKIDNYSATKAELTKKTSLKKEAAPYQNWV